jgi:cbb3-type cytochrome c oxidase subunit II
MRDPLLRRLVPALVWLALTVSVWAALRRPPPSSAVAAGRAVYAGEGCVHCHSQYVRPIESDTSRWGEGGAKNSALVGMRRQGPDLATVGDRRGADYLRLHLLEPTKVMPGTVMPAYAHLFAPGDPRGEALVAYLQSLRATPAE